MASVGQENLGTVMIDFFGALRRGDFDAAAGLGRSRVATPYETQSAKRRASLTGMGTCGRKAATANQNGLSNGTGWPCSVT